MNFAIWCRSFRGPDFPISAHRHGDDYFSFLSFCLQSLSWKKKLKKKKKKRTVVFYSTVGYFMKPDSPEWHSESEFYYRDEQDENVNTENIDKQEQARENWKTATVRDWVARSEKTENTIRKNPVWHEPLEKICYFRW